MKYPVERKESGQFLIKVAGHTSNNAAFEHVTDPGSTLKVLDVVLVRRLKDEATEQGSSYRPTALINKKLGQCGTAQFSPIHHHLATMK